MIDIPALIELLGGDEDCVKELFGIFIEHNVPTIKSVETSYLAGDTETLFHSCHSLSGALSNLCEQDCVPLIQECEQIAKSGSLPEKEKLDLLFAKLKETTAQIENHIK
jgi:HPt (histidine-containing phosphotransfer) domain-containing protein